MFHCLLLLVFFVRSINMTGLWVYIPSLIRKYLKYFFIFHWKFFSVTLTRYNFIISKLNFNLKGIAIGLSHTSKLILKRLKRTEFIDEIYLACSTYEEEIEETIIESTETDQEEIVEEVEVMEEDLDIDVPFAIIEDVPLFPGCERVPKSQRRACFQTNIQKHINKNFRYPEIAQEMGIQGRVFVQFVIDKDGSIVGIRTRGPDKNLEKEAQRIIGKLPTMTPGKQRGRPVRVPFSIPITFKLQ